MLMVTKGNTVQQFDEDRLRNSILDVLNSLGVIDSVYVEKVVRLVKNVEELSSETITDTCIKTALAEVDESAPHWIFVSARFLMLAMYKEASRNRGYDAQDMYGSFYDLQVKLAEMNVYSKDILESYSREEIDELASIIVPSLDELYTYNGLYTLKSRYLAIGYDEEVYELPQERWLTIAMTLMQKEDKANRLHLVKEEYWALSNLYKTVATPTLANSGKPDGQLSSCFIDTVEDSLLSIYNSNTDVARLSKGGGGIGVYKGKIRGAGSQIRNVKGASGGVVPWIKQLNNTAVSVDQTGQRKGAIAVYLEVFHSDINPFLDLRLNNGDDRKRAHDIFTGICIPDLFMEAVEARGRWSLFDPYEVKKVMGWKDDEGNALGLEDFYDEKRGDGTFRRKYKEAVDNPLLRREEVSAISLMARAMRSQLETGTPYMFYRDEVNRMNTNKRFRSDGTGVTTIYSSNLCTEIAQNMSPTVVIEELLDEANGESITRKKLGDFVVCNLASINLGRAYRANVLERLIAITVRSLDNVIDVNRIEVLQAQRTNKRYRGIGLGTFGWHHLLAQEGIHWETEEAVSFADKLYEKINFLTIKASMSIAKEKGAYPLFEDSDWKNGEYFELREYHNDNSELDWDGLRKDVAVNGIRNGYLLAVAPNGQTSVIAGSTASIDPVFKPFFHEEKKDYKLPVVAPELDHRTYDIYRKSAYIVDQRFSVRQNAARQRHIDQAQSFNLYVPKSIKAPILLGLHLQAWKSRVKTTYYTRSTATDIKECEWCES